MKDPVPLPPSPVLGPLAVTGEQNRPKVGTSHQTLAEGVSTPILKLSLATSSEKRGVAWGRGSPNILFPRNHGPASAPPQDPPLTGKGQPLPFALYAQDMRAP